MLDPRRRGDDVFWGRYAYRVSPLQIAQLDKESLGKNIDDIQLTNLKRGFPGRARESLSYLIDLTKNVCVIK